MKKLNYGIGENIRKIRMQKNWSQQKFADKLNSFLYKYNIKGNYDNKTISKWENGDSLPLLDVLIVITKEFNISLDELLKEKVNDLKYKQQIKDDVNLHILDKFLKYKEVCNFKDDNHFSSWNVNNYCYGLLSYIMDNIICYHSDIDKKFIFKENYKQSEILVGLIDLQEDNFIPYFYGNEKKQYCFC